MYLLGIGLVLLAMKYLEIGIVTGWAWWIVLSPFGLAVVWWSWADASGYTKRKAMERENARREERINRSREVLGTGSKKKQR